MTRCCPFSMIWICCDAKIIELCNLVLDLKFANYENHYDSSIKHTYFVVLSSCFSIIEEIKKKDIPVD